jgi:hypothetical protein
MSLTECIRLIGEGTGDDPTVDDELRLYAVNRFLECLNVLSLSLSSLSCYFLSLHLHFHYHLHLTLRTQDAHLPDALVQVISWVIGEYWYLTDLAPEVPLSFLFVLLLRFYHNFKLIYFSL